jgi:hypothetical protein
MKKYLKYIIPATLYMLYTLVIHYILFEWLMVRGSRYTCAYGLLTLPVLGFSGYLINKKEKLKK